MSDKLPLNIQKCKCIIFPGNSNEQFYYSVDISLLIRVDQTKDLDIIQIKFFSSR